MLVTPEDAAEEDDPGKDHGLDAWQKFARDIAAREGAKDGAPVRLMITGAAGTGKSSTIRAIVCARRRGLKGLARRQACLLAAPTGCASFQMKNGATTIHRAFGVPISFCGPTSRKVKESPLFVKRKRRLLAAKLIVID